MTESHEASYLFKFLLMANMCLYLEAGAIPAMLIQISEAFDMSAGLQGILGGIAYLSLGFGSPFAGFLMRNYDHKVVLGYAVGVNSLLTLMWSLTPVGLWYSSSLFIFIRFLMGLMQCVVCVFLPLWTNEFAPATERTKWMGALQASVPFGVMGGYIIAAVMIGPVKGTTTCYGLYCWRWPLLVEWVMLVPFCIAVHFVPSKHLVMRIGKELEDATLTLSPNPGSRKDGNMSPEGGNEDENLLDEEAEIPSRFSPTVPNPRTPLNKYKPREYSSVGEVEFARSQLSQEAEELQRRNWHTVRRHSMTASIYSSYSIGGTFNKSPADINPFSILVMDHEFDSNNGYESLSLSLDEYEHQLHPRGNRTRSNSEPSHLDYSLIHEVMSGTPTSKQGIGNDDISGSHADEFSTSPIVTENELPEYESLSSVIRQYNRDSVGPLESTNGCSDGNRISFSDRRLSRFNLHRGFQYSEMDNEGGLADSLHPSRLSKMQDSDADSESDAFAYLFDSIRSPMKRQSSRRTESSLENDSSWTNCFQSITHLSSNVQSLFRIPVYRYLLFALSSLYFVVTGIQFWGTSYMLVALSAPRSVVNTMFVICAGTGPTLGVFYGGWIIDKMGGYVGSKQRVISLKICFITGILAGIFATIGSLVDHFYTFICCLWLILFFGASLLPACTGMLVSVVPRKHRPISSSLSIFIFNIFGYSFSLFLSGYLMQIVGFYFPNCDMVCSRKIGFRLILLWSYWSLLFLFLALWSAINYQKKREASIH